jgi:CheY-like chemotaxis protein
MTPVSHQPFIVYCDDDEDDLCFLREYLEGYCPDLRLQTFSCSSEALRFLEQLAEAGDKPSLVILDINMPPLSGKDLLIRLRTNPFYDDVPLTLFTTSSMTHDYQFALQHNASFITKPMHLSQLRMIAQTLIEVASEKVSKG